MAEESNSHLMSPESSPEVKRRRVSLDLPTPEPPLPRVSSFFCPLPPEPFSLDLPVSPMIFIPTMAPFVTKEDLTELFGEFGELKGVDITDNTNCDPNKEAVIEYCNGDDAKRAILLYHNRKLDGLPMQFHLPIWDQNIKKFKRESQHTSKALKHYDPDKVSIVRVENLLWGTTPKLLMDFFSKIGRVINVTKNFSKAEITFRNRKDAERAVRMYHKKMLSCERSGLGGLPLELKIVPKWTLGVDVENARAQKDSVLIRLQTQQLREQDIEIEDLKKQVAELKRKTENDHDRNTLLNKNERLKQRLREIKDVVQTDPFFRK